MQELSCLKIMGEEDLYLYPISKINNLHLFYNENTRSEYWIIVLKALINNNYTVLMNKLNKIILIDIKLFSLSNKCIYYI